MSKSPGRVIRTAHARFSGASPTTASAASFAALLAAVLTAVLAIVLTAVLTVVIGIALCPRAGVYAAEISGEPPVAFSPGAPGGGASPVDVPSDWAKEDVYKARDYGLIPDGMFHSFAKNITRADFCGLVMALYSKITMEPEKQFYRSPFTDTDDKSVLNAHALGIVKGVGGGYFAPKNAITRQEIAVMVYNSIGAIDGATGKNILRGETAAVAFSDKALAAEWAVDAIQTLRNNEIMIGDDRNRFNPLDNTTKEMAFILVNRIYLIYSGLDAKKAFPAAYTGDIIMRIKGSFVSGGDYLIIGDVYEQYPPLTLSELDVYLEGGAFADGDKEYFIDDSESLSESVAAGYPGSAMGGSRFYPVYVLVRAGAPQDKLYIIRAGKQYGVFLDAGQKSPFLQKTFSDVLFTVPGDTDVYLNGEGAAVTGVEEVADKTPGQADADGGDADAGGETPDGALKSGASILKSMGNFSFELLHSDAPGLLDAYIWLVRLSKGKVARLIALEVI